MAHFSDQAGYDVRFEWGLLGLRALMDEADVIVVVDVLSFSTCVALAVGRGASILPYRWGDGTAAEHARSHGALLAGHRGDPGAPYSLSPASLAGIPAGTRLVLPSPNGSTLSFEASRQGAVLAGCLRNCGAVAARARASRRPVAVIAAGERWSDASLRPALEDLIGAGAIIARLPGSRSPEAAAAAAAYEQAAADPFGALVHCASGRELLQRGFPRDVELAAQVDASPVAPRLREGVFVAESSV